MTDTVKEMSVPEKSILAEFVPETEPLPYPTRRMRMPRGYRSETEYIVPEADKKAVLEQLYPFVECPGMDDVLYDLHTQKRFRVGDYRVIRCGGRNLLVSPYYPQGGGMVVDWVRDPDEMECLPIKGGMKVVTKMKKTERG